MALLNISIGLSFGSGVINSVVGDLKQVISSAKASSKAVDDIGKKNDILKTFQGFASIGTDLIVAPFEPGENYSHRRKS